MKKLLKANCCYILVFIFIAISGFTLFICADDYIWFYAFSDDRLSSYASPNGRYFSNFIILYSVQCIPAFSLLHIPVTAKPSSTLSYPRYQLLLPSQNRQVNLLPPRLCWRLRVTYIGNNCCPCFFGIQSNRFYVGRPRTAR